MIAQIAAARKLLLLSLCCLFVGCGPELSPEDLGTVVYEVPKFDPHEQKYPLPKLPPAPEGEEALHKHDGHDHAHDHGHDHNHDHSHEK